MASFIIVSALGQHLARSMKKCGGQVTMAWEEAHDHGDVLNIGFHAQHKGYVMLSECCVGHTL